jgi:hypothetical protein
MAAKVIYSLMISLGDELGNTILSTDDTNETRTRDQLAESMIAANRAYTDAMERILSVTRGSINLIQEPMLREWIAP